MFPVPLPPLRKRAQHFLRQACRHARRAVETQAVERLGLTRQSLQQMLRRRQ